MGLGLFAVIGKRNIASFSGQRDRDSSHKRYSFISRSKQHIEIHAGLKQGIGIIIGEFSERLAVIEQTGIEKIGRSPARLRYKFPKTQNTAIDSETDELFS